MNNSNVAQLKESVPTSGQLVGSFYSGNQSQLQARSDKQGHCPACNEPMVPQSKFCGDCGSPAEQHTHSAHELTVPAFAQVSQQMSKAVPPELKKEYRKLTTLLARERFFLIAHYLIFLFVNLLGFWIAVKAYNGLFC